jgi:preprotein translocase subunit YajC
MFIGDEREIVHLSADWSIVLSALLWVWLSLTVTVLAVREQLKRQKAQKEEINEREEYEEPEW